MQRSYLDYAMSVIVSRALPDVRDGLKPVHRRILYAMNEMSLHWNKSYRKSAGVVGEVMGKYHPHGDKSIYDALVRMAQEFSLRDPLINGQGNFGSIDGDSAAAMRYTECKLEKISEFLLHDIDKDTVDFQANYDGREQEPVVLPTRFPNLLVNGAGGIAVGMATNIPPHNLGELLQACLALIDNPNISLDEILEFIPGPDFPTAGIILGKAGIRSAYETGRGSIVVRAKVDIEQMSNDRERLVITQIPYQVNKATMIEKIAELVRGKRIEGISDLRDESDRDGYRVVIELKRDAVAEVVLNQLFKYTPLQSTFSVNMVALNSGKPELMSLLSILRAFINFREEVVSRRTKYLLRKTREKAHILVGLAIAVANIDEIIQLIRHAPDPAAAREQLLARNWDARNVETLLQLIDDPLHQILDDKTYKLSQEQAKAILDLRLQRLTALGCDEIGEDLNKLGQEISDYLQILASRERIMSIVKEELSLVSEEFSTPRRTTFGSAIGDVQDEDLIAREDMVITVSHAGYIKRVPLATYRAQKRGGKGRSGMSTKDEDVVTKLFISSTHTSVLFFSSKGMVYKEKVWRLPLCSPQARGKALINLLPLSQGETITSILLLPEEQEKWSQLDVMFATSSGTVRRNKLSDFVQINRNGKIAMKLETSEDKILSVQTCTADDDILLTSAGGFTVRFPVNDVRVFSGRNSVGVRGIRLEKGDRVISMAVIKHINVEYQERQAYLKAALLERKLEQNIDEELIDADDNSEDVNIDKFKLSKERYEELREKEEFLLTVTEQGYGKRSSSYSFRISGRGGKGIRSTDFNKVNEIGNLVSLFPVEHDDQIMLVSDGGQLIRVPVADIRIARPSSKGVKIFNTADDEKVVSVESISENDCDNDNIDEMKID
ncbi:DNA gyrase subunit A [Bartonella sp. DGB1]|uniref:DNA gyrase subunit A n=1 Tax=Bartonella sp. DGB1 TaxID=3239807 RepID=UPI00352648D3